MTTLDEKFSKLGPTPTLVQCNDCQAAIPDGFQMSHLQWHRALPIKNMFGGLF